ncbi:hypothetical protein PAXINDRAFT_172267 [Paxillus involutus ATCC 200175]|uniref:Uncharacterized protein n=1 Tax=Paxillus involutus ATCC 200175 TaxID=664439 RepID=A0A0C9SQX6_PAXIN|nr:hypothetical protein PAXINDRAFT_172267 [Paxillus involutus ATCC 200175]
MFHGKEISVLGTKSFGYIPPSTARRILVLDRDERMAIRHVSHTGNLQAMHVINHQLSTDGPRLFHGIPGQMTVKYRRPLQVSADDHRVPYRQRGTMCG